MPAATAKHPQTVKEFLSVQRCPPAGRIGRVAIVSDSLPERNGVGAYYCDLRDQMRARGVEASLICPDPDKDFNKFPLPGDATQRIWIPSYRRFKREMKALDPEVIIAATPGPYGLVAARFARLLRIPLIVGFHTHFSGVTDQYESFLLRGFSRFYFNLADKILFRYGDLVLANSEAMVKLASRLGARRAEVMGTLLPKAALEHAPTPIRDRVESVLFAGRLAPEKRVHWVIEAARQLPDIAFRIAGEGPLRSNVQAAASELPNLSYVGWVSRDALLAEMDRADLLVLPSVVESFGTVALEAMARERLALVTPTCGIVEWPVLADALYKLDADEDLTAGIRRIAELPAEARRESALRARKAALDLNENSLMHWFGILEVDDGADDHDGFQGDSD